MSTEKNHVPDMISDYGLSEDAQVDGGLADCTEASTDYTAEGGMDWDSAQYHFSKNGDTKCYSQEAIGAVPGSDFDGEEVVGIGYDDAYSRRYPSLLDYKLTLELSPQVADLLGRVNLSGVTRPLVNALERGGYLNKLDEADQARLEELALKGYDIDLHTLQQLHVNGYEFFANYIDSYLLFGNTLPRLILNSLLHSDVFVLRD